MASSITKEVRKKIKTTIKTILFELDPTLSEDIVLYKTVLIEQKLYTEAMFYSNPCIYYQCLETLTERINKVLSEFEVLDRFTERLYGF
jgi:hypothetical protein